MHDTSSAGPPLRITWHTLRMPCCREDPRQGADDAAGGRSSQVTGQEMHSCSQRMRTFGALPPGTMASRWRAFNDVAFLENSGGLCP